MESLLKRSMVSTIKTDAMDDIEVDPYAVDEATKETFNKINLRLQK